MKFLLSFAFLLLSIVAIAQTDSSTRLLYPNGAPDSNGITLPEQSDALHSCYVTSPTLTTYLPAQPNGTAILCLPGGGYFDVWYGTEGHNLATWFTDRGYAFYVLKYRLPNGHPDIPLRDVQTALRTLRASGAQRVGIMGFSAGAHLAATAATTPSATSLQSATAIACNSPSGVPSATPDFQILFYPVISMDTTITHMGSRDNLLGVQPSDSLVAAYSCELRVTPTTPPALIFHSDDDGLVPVENSLRYYAALRKNGVRASLHVFPTGGHGWCSHEYFPYRSLWFAELEQWLKMLQ